jgi:Domain of unknown function (DUF397)
VTRSTARGRAKPAVADLGIDPAELDWARSGDGDGSIEVAFPVGPGRATGDWVLLRVAGDAAGRILVFDRNEWECFIDGARNGEFDDATEKPARTPRSGEPDETGRPAE